MCDRLLKHTMQQTRDETRDVCCDVMRARPRGRGRRTKTHTHHSTRPCAISRRERLADLLDWPVTPPDLDERADQVAHHILHKTSASKSQLKHLNVALNLRGAR